jgi:dienelactone hydrolase
MAEIVLFHHALGLTPGVTTFAERLRTAGHVVYTPDLYDERTFTELVDGVAYARNTGFNTIMERGTNAAEGLPSDVVYAGISLGVMPAQMLAQTRAGARGALLFSACITPSEFGGDWPKGVPVQIHMMENDPEVLEGDLDAARDLAESTDDAELFLYPGDGHLFMDNSLPDYDEKATTQLRERVLDFLDTNK